MRSLGRVGQDAGDPDGIPAHLLGDGAIDVFRGYDRQGARLRRRGLRRQGEGRQEKERLHGAGPARPPRHAQPVPAQAPQVPSISTIVVDGRKPLARAACSSA